MSLSSLDLVNGAVAKICYSSVFSFTVSAENIRENFACIYCYGALVLRNTEIALNTSVLYLYRQ